MPEKVEFSIKKMMRQTLIITNRSIPQEGISTYACKYVSSNSNAYAPNRELHRQKLKEPKGETDK